MRYRALVLCADDSVYVLEGWKALLERNGFRVLTANDGKEAFQIFVSHPVDLVLLDYHMPYMNGDEAAIHMRAHKRDVPIAILSADDLPAPADPKAVDALISKSEPIGRVLEIVDHLLSLRLLFQPFNNSEGENAA
jgi:CheY-like chemotaxis protein